MIVERIDRVPEGTGRRGLVPTMGALHEGHLSLIRTAKSECDDVVVSVFVNPTQFGPTEDFDRYPRRLREDADLAMAAGATWVFAPSVEEMYPRRTTSVVVREVTESYEGERRPGHFDGVSTVVLKLFNIVSPQTAYFGQKDLQQCQVIRRMVEDLNVPVRLRFCETVRESDGLAMSSRNAYLTPEQRAIAPALYRTLGRLKNVVSALDADDLRAKLDEAKASLTGQGFRVDYLDLVGLSDMRPRRSAEGECALAVAAFLGHTRLIDNVAIGD